MPTLPQDRFLSPALRLPGRIPAGAAPLLGAMHGVLAVRGHGGRLQTAGIGAEGDRGGDGKGARHGLVFLRFLVPARALPVSGMQGHLQAQGLCGGVLL